MPRNLLPTDNFDRMVELLQDIRNILDGEGDSTNTQGPAGLPTGLRPLTRSVYQIRETSDLPDDALNSNDAVEVQPGETKTIVRHEVKGTAALMAVGATDAADCEYWVAVDEEVAGGGRTNSPLGSINDPFSYVDTLEGYVPANLRVEYKVRLDSSATSSVELVGRMYLLDN